MHTHRQTGKTIQKFASYLLAFVLVLGIMPTMVFAATATVSDGSVAGTVGQALDSPVTLTITIADDTLKAKINAGDNLASWITNLPAGLTAVADADAEIGATEVVVKIDGTPTEDSQLFMVITIPAGVLTTETGAVTVAENWNTLFSIDATAADTITVANVTVTGEVGTALDSPVEVVLTANNDGFAAATAGDDVSDWIYNLPDGLTAEVKSDVTAGELSLTIEIDDTPTEASDDSMIIGVPNTALVGGASYGGVSARTNFSAKFAITDPNAPSATVSGGSVTGTVGAALSGPVDITIAITNDDLKAAITAGEDLSGWILNLPDGLTAVAKSDAAINTTSVTITINGTPTGWCVEPMDIRIPAAALTKGAAVKVTMNSSVKITIPDPDDTSGGGGGGGGGNPDPDPGDGDDDDDNNNSSGGGYTSDRDDDDDDDDNNNRNSNSFWGSLLGGREQNTPVTVTTQSAASAMDSAVEAALAAGDDTATATIRNAGEISLSTLRSMANQSDMAVKLNADSMSADGKSVEVRVTLDPALSTKGVNLFASTTNDAAQLIEDRFERFYTNDVSVVHFDQQGDFGQTVSVAVRIDPALNTDSLRFYAYDKAANTYRPIETTYWLDANGYVHFSTTRAGDIVITDAPLAKN